MFQNTLFAIAIILGSFGIGITQRIILGRAILLRFPKLQNHAKIVSIPLFFIFLANAVLSVPRFTSPEKIEVSTIFEATNFNEIASLIFTILGVNTEFLAILAISVTIVTLLLLRSTKISGSQRYFVLFFSIFILVITGISRFSDLTPSHFETFLYFLYHLGITIGIVGGTVKKLKNKVK